ncbi:MAG: PilZ domain-containing protein [Deltaproteobacteria bacterium]|nr:MAG: PilZ domain-containing protein [Deltaproteobacteria bacterium]
MSSIERRLYPRILVKWPAVVETLHGFIQGVTKDISVDGVFIQCSEEPELREVFQILLKPTVKKSISVTARHVWSGTFKTGKTDVFGMGVQFTSISTKDRQFISTLVEQESSK